MEKKGTIVFMPEGKRSEAKIGMKLLEVSKKIGVDIESICGGKGTCGKCKVILDRGMENLNKVTANERRRLPEDLINKGYRLACEAELEKFEELYRVGQAHAHVIITVPPESRGGTQRILTDGVKTEITLAPSVSKCYLELPKPTLEDFRADYERVMDGLKEDYDLDGLEVELDLLGQFPQVLRDSDWKVTLGLLENREIVSIEPGLTVERKYGLAVDIGTTTVVGYLINLHTGKVLSIKSFLNPQVSYGEDVMTRITYCNENQDVGLAKLNEKIVGCINDIMDQTSKEAGIKPEEILELTIVGNTAMHHIFLNINPKYLSLAPFPPVVKRSVNVKAKELGLKANPRANVHVLPVIAGFVGADNVGVILSTNMYDEEELTYAVDIGTNGEMVLGNKDFISVCSCAAGPALEGAHIKHGMRGTTGAIERVRIDPSTLKLEYQTIDNVPARGICGSGIIDVTAEMFKAGVMLRNGVINKELKTDRIRIANGGPEFVVAWEKETAEGVGDIVMTQGDIREIQLAKAAFYAGAKLLMVNRKVKEEDVKRVYIAGAFGNYIDKANAKTIGLYPDFPLERVKSVGNAAGSGAQQALLSKEKRKDAINIAEKANYIELTIDPNFQFEYISAMYFPHSDINRFPSMKKICKNLPMWSKILKN